ncbi:hypothetical protein HYH03_018702 [Edaphochlamys debaryana]|uniref:Right handed beta helix domain-containing protein n=1 Tax=Edaphochlamys debaryana TaxID=47281 RepID=A0A836BN18_9CHLO|nr:hypothetical protein HYH03_018702 [Edaphochlamys debaryana]|eukprot:KAG2482352.1 hypothetical protein HYH03_018702 [Edaphochlamys debaryana]
MSVTERDYAGAAFRSLIRFPDVDKIIPANSTIQSASLTLSFVNYNQPVLIQACFVTRRWDYLPNPALYNPDKATTGWRQSSLGKNWTQLGGWADCSPDVNIRCLNGSVYQTSSAYNGSNALMRRPALSIEYSAPGTPPNTPADLKPFPYTLGKSPRTWWVGPAGNDDLNSGHFDSPFKTPRKAIFEASPWDVVLLRTGVYPGALQVDKPGLTISSGPREWAVIASPLTDPQNAVNVFTLRPGADYGTLSNLEITGGFYYGKCVMFFTSWENYGPMALRVSNATAPSHWTFSNVRIHGTGSSGVKLTMKANNNTFSRVEVFNTGTRYRVGGHGIEAVQAYDTVVRDCYLHDIPAAGVHLAGGTARTLLERNFVARTNFGFNLGFDTEYEYMDPFNNPKLCESVNTTARNNIIAATYMAGMNVWAGCNVVIAHNTLWQVQENAQNAILLNVMSHTTPNSTILSKSANVTIWANLLVRGPMARYGPIVDIREDGLDPGSTLVMAYNVYRDQDGSRVFLEDERNATRFTGNHTAWAAHCRDALGQAACDLGSADADPLLDPAFTPLGCSPALRRANRTAPGGRVLVTDDFHGRARPAAPRLFDSGAVQTGATGPGKAVPPAFPWSTRAPFAGIGVRPGYGREWPYDWWQTRPCKDLMVDPSNGSDYQAWNRDSNYTTFRTVSKALELINQCDRILLRGGKNHTGGWGIYRPNVTITTHPADLPKRATVLCKDTGSTPCIRSGDGFYGGAAYINLTNFDILMTGSASGSCIHLNEGSAGGTSAYWSWYLTNANRTAGRYSTIRLLNLINCGLHGIKLSTFVRSVQITQNNFISPSETGIEVRGGGDLRISLNRILDPGSTGIRLGGGARDCVVERNYIRNYGDRGILLGSDNTEVQYMDVDWARTQSPPSWHDNINSLVRNNIIDGGAGAGIGFYSARDAVVVHNTFLNVAKSMQAGVLGNISPKLLAPTWQVGEPNRNIVFKNNIVTLGGDTEYNLMIEMRIMQADVVNQRINWTRADATCPVTGHHHHHHHRRLLASLDPTAADDSSSEATAARAAASQYPLQAPQSNEEEEEGALEGSEVAVGGSQGAAAAQRRRLGGLSFAQAFVNKPGTADRNPDGSCPLFPPDHEWYRDVSQLPLHPNGDAIKTRIHPTRTLHADWGGGEMRGGKFMLYGIPYITVDSRTQPMVPLVFSKGAYSDESDIQAGYPFPAPAPVEGAWTNCPDATCGGDRHVLVIDNATCLLYETWRTFPPALTASGQWEAMIVARFNLSQNALGRPLGWTSSDAAGLAVLPGLVRWDEVMVKGEINHAIRFTGPNSRRAYAPPATHFAPAGYSGPDAPYMGLRVRLRASYDCGPLKHVARVFCTALKKYGGIFADNGSPWFFTGEANANWGSVLDQIGDISRINATDMEILDSGCVCTDIECRLAECGGVPNIDPSALSVYAAMANTSDMAFANNIYYKPPGLPARYVDRRAPPLGPGYDGDLGGWKNYTGGDRGSFEADPRIDPASFKPRQGSPAIAAVPRLASADRDYANRPRAGNLTDAGAMLA